MEFRDLKYFIKLVELKNYNKTALHFGVTQPTISTMVRRLEKELRTKLLFQGNNRSSLVVTPAGKVVFHKAIQILRLEKSIQIEAQRANQNNFRLGYSEIAGSAWLASTITKLNQGHLLASVTTREENSHFLEQHLRDGKYDAIVFTRLGNENFKGISVNNLHEYQYDLIVPANSELAHPKKINIFQIRNKYPLIMRHKRFLSRIALEQVFSETGFRPNKKLILDNIDATVQLIAKNMGVGYLMNIAVKNYPQVKAIPLVPSQRVYCYSCLGLREDFIPNQIQKRCINILRNTKN